MYIPQIENLYIFYSTRVLFSYSKKSYEYKKPIFENPLPNARFDADYHQINTSWRKNLSMTPLFVSNQEEVVNFI